MTGLFFINFSRFTYFAYIFITPDDYQTLKGRI